VHYRAPLNLEWEQDDSGKLLGFPQFEEAEARLEYVYATRQRLGAIPAERIRDADEPAPADITEFATRLAHALDDDLNTPVALAHAAGLLKAVNELCDRAQAKKGSVSRVAVAASEAAFKALETRLGIGSQDPAAFSCRVRDRRAVKLGIQKTDVEARIRDRAQARADKNFARSDQIRDELAAWGVELLDRPDGTDWRLTRRSPPTDA
jgi:cysteinyl-tRNA synthetase